MDRYFLFYLKLAKFDEFLVISQGGQLLIYIFPHVLLLEIALHSLVWDISSRESIDYGITF